MVLNKISSFIYAALSLMLASGCTQISWAQVRESAGLENFSSEADRQMADDADGIFIDSCDLAYVDFAANNIKNLAIDTVVSPDPAYDSEVMGAIINNLNPGKAAQLNGKSFSVISCKKNRSAGAHGKLILGKDGLPKLLFLESGIRYPQAKSNLTGSYKVVASLDSIYVENKGFGYASADKIKIEPSHGASAQPIIQNGKITEVKVLTSGTGFTGIPKVFVDGQGYNAALKPILQFKKVPSGNSSAGIWVNKAPIDPTVACKGIECYRR